MNTEEISISLHEWQTLGPTEGLPLAGRYFDASPATRRVVDLLQRGRRLGLSELKQGLEISAFSHVGRVRIGRLTITVLPKIKGMLLLNLMRYAYGFRRLNLVSDSTHPVDHFGLEDLLICQLNAEVRELFARGLRRAYIANFDWLGSPRGRIDLNRLAMDGGKITATLPCHHHPRIEDILLNQALLAGLRLAASMASVIELQRDCRRLASFIEEQVSAVTLDGPLLDRAARQMNRLTAAYGPAMSIVRLLVESQGVLLEGQTNSATLPGFLFDMNAFFQALMLRFLSDNLAGLSVRAEQALKGMMRYNPRFNPRKRQSPTPRPDYVVLKQGAVCCLLDAKYRDLWEQSLPPEMLYQLVVYAISQRRQPQSSILYPTMDSHAKEARIDVSDPVYGRNLGQVCLRPVLMPKIETLIGDRGLTARRERERYARQLAFGEMN